MSSGDRDGSVVQDSQDMIRKRSDKRNEVEEVLIVSI